eukprot:8747804-Ditylum_brightwellii.AAC.1
MPDQRHGGSDFATVDIPGAFMQANMDEAVHMKIEGTVAELLTKLDPKLYRHHKQAANSIWEGSTTYHQQGQGAQLSWYDAGLHVSKKDDFDGGATTAAANHLFEIDEKAEKLDNKDGEFVHHVVAKLLFLCKRASPDLQTSVAFLSTRVKSPNVDDWKKLRRMMRYLQSTKNLVLTLEAEDTGCITWWVDAAFAVHHDLKSHTGGVMTMERGPYLLPPPSRN